MEEKTGKLIVIVAPSGTGKSSLMRRLKKENLLLDESISYTTRPIRPGEEDGRDYFFVGHDDFKSMIKNDEFIEWFLVHGEYKGTSKKFVEKKVNKGHNLIFDLDIQGTDAIKKFFPKQAIAIFIKPPSFEVLKDRLIGRGTESENTLKVRLENAKKELMRSDDYDYIVVNDDLNRAYEELRQLVIKLIK
jgi:guanylate kinase